MTAPRTAYYVTGRNATPAEYQRRYRHGRRSQVPCGHPDVVWEERRNGLPLTRPYTYRGNGPYLHEDGEAS